MNVVFLRSNPVDPDSRVEKEVISLIKDNHHVMILGWDRNYKYKLKESILKIGSYSIKIHRFGIPATYGGGLKSNLLPLISFQFRLMWWLIKNKNKYDVIHSCDFDTAFISKKIAALLHKKFVYDIFDYYVDAFNVPTNFKKIIKGLDNKIINSSDAVIICSEKRSEQIIGTNPKLLRVIHNTPYKIDLQKTEYYKDNNKIKIVYVGILSKGRFIDEIIDIVAKNANYELHIGGFGELEDNVKISSNLHKNIIFYGKLSYEKTLELEGMCDVMTALYDPKIPNHKYAAPNKFYEALMLGKPLIMIKETGMDYIVEKNDIGVVVDSNYNCIEEGLADIANRRSEWPIMAEKMKKLYDEFYDWDVMEIRLQALYKQI